MIIKIMAGILLDATYVNGGHVIFRGSLDGQNHVIKNFTSIYQSQQQLHCQQVLTPVAMEKVLMAYLVMRSMQL